MSAFKSVIYCRSRLSIVRIICKKILCHALLLVLFCFVIFSFFLVSACNDGILPDPDGSKNMAVVKN